MVLEDWFRTFVLLLTLCMSQGCNATVTPTLSSAVPTVILPADFVENVQIVVEAIQAKDPELFRSLIGEKGVAVGGFAQGLGFKGYNNTDEIMEAFTRALDHSAPVCKGFFSYVGGLPDKAILVYQGINFNWERFGMSGNESDGMTLQLFKLPEGWKLVYVTPFDFEKDVASLGPLQACPKRTEFHTVESRSIPSPSLTAAITLTRVPPNVFVLFFYPPLIMNYDPSIWGDRSNYQDWGLNFNPRAGVIIKNYLQALQFEECHIGVVGPSGYFPVADEIVLLGKVRYQLTTSESPQSATKTGHYIEDQFLTNYDYDRYGLPVLEIGAALSKWDQCKKMGENILSTLRVP
jgi:hypothetical protein